MKSVLCYLLVLVLGFHARAASVDRLLELLTRQMPGHENTPNTAPYEKPDNYWHEPDYEHDKMSGFPKCNLIGDFFEEFWSIPSYTNIEIIDEIKYRPEMLHVMTSALESYRGLDDHEAVALLTARKLAKTIFMDRLRCPATMMERFIITVMKREMDRMTEGDYSLMSRLIPVLVRLPHMETVDQTAESLARLVARETHSRIYNDSMYEILSWSMRDVTEATEYIYRTLKAKLPHLRTVGPEEISAYLDGILIENLHRVYCPSFMEVVYRHSHAFWEFAHGLREIEAYELCSEVKDFIGWHVPEPYHTPGHPGREEPYITGVPGTEYNAVIEESCEIISNYIKEVVELLTRIENMISTGDPANVVKMAEPYLTTEELQLLNKVMGKLYNGLSVADVIAYEEEDIKHWDSFLEGLSAEKFEAMTKNELEETIMTWLNDKRERLEQYMKYSEEYPIH